MSDLNRVLPHSEEAEKGVLGAIFLDAFRLAPAAIGAGVKPEWFYVPAHRIIWETIERMSEKGKAIDLLTASTALKDAGMMDRIGGPTALDRMVDATPSASHFEYYLEIVRNKFYLRRVIEVCRDTEQEAHTTEDGGKLLSGLSGRFLDVHGDVRREVSNADLMQASTDRWDAVKKGAEPDIGIETPFYKLTRILCGLETGITIVAGRPSAGKTTLEDIIALHAAEQCGIAVARSTMDSTAKQLLQRSICRRAQVSLPKLKFGFARADQVEDTKLAAKRIAQFPFWINDWSNDLAEIRAWFRLMKAKRNVGLATLDHLGLVWASEMGKQNWDTYARTTYVSGQLKALSLEMGIPMLVLSQLSRANAKDNREPELQDLRDSGAIEQDANKVIMVWIDEKKKKEMEDKHPGATKHKRPCWMKVAKNKDGECGKIPFWLYPAYFKFEVDESGCFQDDTLPLEAHEAEGRQQTTDYRPQTEEERPKNLGGVARQRAFEVLAEEPERSNT